MHHLKKIFSGSMTSNPPNQRMALPHAAYRFAARNSHKLKKKLPPPPWQILHAPMLLNSNILCEAAQNVQSLFSRGIRMFQLHVMYSNGKISTECMQPFSCKGS